MALQRGSYDFVNNPGVKGSSFLDRIDGMIRENKGGKSEVRRNPRRGLSPEGYPDRPTLGFFRCHSAFSWRNWDKNPVSCQKVSA